MEQDFYERWNWYEVLLGYCNGDIEQMDNKAGLNLYIVLNDLVYKTQKNQIEISKNRK